MYASRATLVNRNFNPTDQQTITCAQSSFKRLIFCFFGRDKFIVIRPKEKGKNVDFFSVRLELHEFELVLKITAGVCERIAKRDRLNILFLYIFFFLQPVGAKSHFVYTVYGTRALTIHPVYGFLLSRFRVKRKTLLHSSPAAADARVIGPKRKISIRLFIHFIGTVW